MNRYTFDEIVPGQTERFSATISAELMEEFRRITGDVNPLHCDDEYARQRGYKGRVVYGMLTSSFYSTLAGVYLPGERALLHSVETKLLKPVFIGDELTIEGKVAEKHDVFRTIVVKATITNQLGEKVSRATIQIGVSE